MHLLYCIYIYIYFLWRISFYRWCPACMVSQTTSDCVSPLFTLTTTPWQLGYGISNLPWSEEYFTFPAAAQWYYPMLLEGVGSFRLIKNNEGSIERLRDQNLVNTVAGFCIVWLQTGKGNLPCVNLISNDQLLMVMALKLQQWNVVQRLCISIYAI